MSQPSARPTTLVRALVLAPLLALAACGGSGGTTEPPRIASFSASQSRVAAGQTVTLGYEVVGADSVRIATQGGDVILPDTARIQGSVTTPALQVTTSYVLTARSAGGTASQTITVEVIEAAPEVVRFTASPETLDAPGMSTLTWETRNGSAARIEVGGRALYPIPAEQIGSGSYEARVDATTSYRLVVVNASGAEASATVDVTLSSTTTDPTVVRFVAEPPILDAGDSTTLRWEVVRARTISVSDAAGRSVAEGTNLAGSVVVTPEETTRYTLTAVDAEGDRASATVQVTVNQPTGARIASFTINPSRIARGDSATVAWEVERALGGIELRADGALVTRSSEGRGSLTVMPVSTTAYTLTALSPNGDSVATATVTVDAPPPAVLAFAAAPTQVPLAGRTRLSWEVTNATRVRILRAGTEVFSGSGASANAANLQVDVPAELNTFTLEALSPGQVTASRQLTVYGHPAPTVVRFRASPPSRAAAGNVTLSWEVLDVSALQLTAGGQPVAGFTPISTATTARDYRGTVQVPVAATTTFVLAASSAVGTVTRSLTVNVAPAQAETEPNGTVAAAGTLGAGGVVSGQLAAGDLDFFLVTVPEGGSVRAQTSDGLGGCATDTVLRLLDARGAVLTFDDDSGGATCSEIDPIRDPRAGNLAAGTYYVVVLHGSATGTGSYQLDVTTAAPSCGNAIAESRANEQCDLGDRLPGDGCSATCQYEVSPLTLSGTGGTVRLALNGANAFALLRVDVGVAGSSIRAVAADVGLTSCDEVDTALQLADGQFRVLAFRSDGGPRGRAGTCASIEPPTEPAAGNLAPGTYYLGVFAEAPGTGLIQVRVQIDPPSCGNGVIETLAGEQCDGPLPFPGTVPTCGVSCELEADVSVGVPVFDPHRIAGSLPAGAGQTVELRVTARTRLRVETFAPTQAQGCATADTVLELWSEDLRVLAVDDQGGVGACSRLSESRAPMVLEPGRYYLFSYAFDPAVAIPATELVVSTVALGTPAPLRELEPNDEQRTATSTGLVGAGRAVMVGGVDRVGDDDVYSLTIPAGQTRRITARTLDDLGSTTGCAPSNPLSDTRLSLEAAGAPASGAGVGALAFSEDVSATNWCSAITAVEVAGGVGGAVYHLRVQGFDDQELAEYFLDVTVQ
jgi:cysteine-rich repeat protein